MPKAKDYPEWFNVNSKPRCPSKPKKPLKEEETNQIIRQDAKVDFTFTKDELLSIDFDSLQISSGPLTGNVCINFYKKGFQPNKSYDLLMSYYKSYLETYKKEKEEYNKQVKEWPLLVEKWKAEKYEEQKKKDLKNLAELQEKYKNAK